MFKKSSFQMAFLSQNIDSSGGPVVNVLR